MSGPELLHELALSERPVWVEMTQSAHQHGGLGWEFGTCLWSPARNASGNDRYAVMRRPIAGDHVAHFYEDAWPDGLTEIRLCGSSRVMSSYKETTVEPPSAGRWSGRGNYYRIELERFKHIDPPLPLQRIRETYAAEILAELGEDQPKHYPFSKYRDDVRTTQGIYLTRATSRLLRLIAEMAEIQAAGSNSETETVVGHQEFAEGQRSRREVFFFSRNPKLVAAAKAHYGFRCMVCNFDFETAYGSLGHAYIECHHLNPLSERAAADWSEDMTTNIDQVAMLCANCHRMIHRKRKALPINDLKQCFVNRETLS